MEIGIVAIGQQLIDVATETLHGLRGMRSMLYRIPGLLHNNTFTVPVLWNTAALKAIRATRPTRPVAAHALASVHTSMYTAWATYDSLATGIPAHAIPRQPAYERTLENKEAAISYAAYHTLQDLFPTQQDSFAKLLLEIGEDGADVKAPGSMPAAIGRLAARLTLAGRRWGPLRAFALSHSGQFRPAGRPAIYHQGSYDSRVMRLLYLNAHLSERQKVRCEYWQAGLDGELVLEQWCQIAHYVARRDAYNLDMAVKLFFTLTNALLDASIACWDCKQVYNLERPVSCIRSRFKDRPILGWGGPHKGTQIIAGQRWQPYQPANLATPASAEYCCEHSTLSAAGSAILSWFTGSDYFGASYTQHAGSSLIEPGSVPASDLTLKWQTFSAAALDAGQSRLHSGVQFAPSVSAGSTLGRNVAALTWRKAQAAIDGKQA